MGQKCQNLYYTLEPPLPYMMNLSPRQDGLVVSVSACHVVGRGFSPRLSHTKDHHENGTNAFRLEHMR